MFGFYGESEGAAEFLTLRAFLRLGLIASLALGPAVWIKAQSLTVLHSFTANPSNADGANPSGSLYLSGNTLYGTTVYGGSVGWGTVFSLGTDGSAFSTIYNFSDGSDGANPSGGVILSNNTLYGTASRGGTSDTGTLFALGSNGSGFNILHTFTARANDSFGLYTNSDGAYPLVGLTLSGGVLYGTANEGGAAGHGTVFSISTSGSGFMTVHSFSSGTGTSYSSAGVLLLGNVLYGANYGNLGNGTVFAVNTDGSLFTNHYAFTSGHVNGVGVLTNSDGANPRSKLILSGNTLYGTAEYGGTFGNGTVFAITTDGTIFRTLHNFGPGGYNSIGLYANADGVNPSAELTLSGNRLYGTASAGGSAGNGTVFALNLDGTGFTNLYNFTATSPYPQQTNSDGANPSGGLILSGYNLYGTTSYGGNSGNGTVFKLSFAPTLTIARSGTNILLTWPANAAGFDYTGLSLQAAPSITGPYTNIPGAASPYTTPASGAHQFYRLGR
jgi:uncharacterized repeat protein (TIGR03803 family)